ncbi:hypothetical protein FB381_1553 [Nocardioides albertanoniae]|uniref:DUF4190 domain-containing protein n=1 Tax=Nocardioides albertanoniae TaxID=1175486 RepID=A0A543A4Z3_9ACTN|nr:hypothetical protein [Nocardioides albertanoniae]TQL67671.1 hypothetical protein FB381_1553 [Nocardioides albertanoniae]
MSQPNGAPSARQPEQAQGAPRSGRTLGLFALVIAVAMLVIIALVRLLVGIPKVSQSYYDAILSFEDRPVIWLILGVAMIASIVPVVAAIVLGHIGLLRAKVDGSSAAMAGIALGIGYMLVVFWVVRLVNAATNAAQFNGGFRMFVEYVGLWA